MTNRMAHILTPRLVLARPQIGENIGSIARLQANFGIPELCIVAPIEGWQHGAHRTASMCRGLLDEARILHDLDEALADCSHIHGFTARSGSDRLVEDVHAGLGPALQMASEPGQKLAFVFGNEESGLSSEETARCTRLFTLPLPGLSSLNLSHAVAIVLAQWQRSSQPEASSRPPARGRHPLLDLEGKQRLSTHVRDRLGTLGFAVDDPHFDGMLRRLVESAEIETRDARILHKILRHLDWLQDPDTR